MARRAALGALLATAAGCAISTQREIEMGTDYARQINQQLPIVEDPEVNRYINLLGDSIARVADDRNLDWRFFIVDEDEVNAFAVPGGFVYINRGLIQRATRMNQLAGVLAHEIGHITERHSVEQMRKAQGANVGLIAGCVLTRICDAPGVGTAIDLGGGALFAKFSRDAEREADVVGIEYLIRAGIDPRGIPQMFRTLLDERRRRPGGVAAWFSTHPLEEERIEYTQSLIARKNAAMLDRLTDDTPRYQAFRDRLRGLPVTATRRNRSD